ncbi:MAG: riboflavin synthase [Candidatus Aminicenantales bacterium]
MFTGIIQHMGIFRGFFQGKREMAVEAPTLFSRVCIGESLAVNGVCLSLIKKQKSLLFFNLSGETLKKTNLGFLPQGARLNLELPVSLSSLLGGHLVTGHIDCCGKLSRIRKRREGTRITVTFPPEIRPFLISKGSVALNGVSLTISELRASSFDVELIPITLKNSNLGDLKRGDEVNIECDMIGKYVYNWLVRERKDRRERS